MKKNLAITTGIAIPYYTLLYATQSEMPKDALFCVILGVVLGVCIELVKYGVSKDEKEK